MADSLPLGLDGRGRKYFVCRQPGYSEQGTIDSELAKLFDGYST
jgi:hypothetical protein